MKKTIGCFFVLVILFVIGYLAYQNRSEVEDKIKSIFEKEEKPVDEQKLDMGQEKTEQTQELQSRFDFVLNSVDGKEYRLSELKGNIVLVDFWATWCPPCRRAIPYLCEIYNEYKEKGLIILGVSCDEGPSDLLIEGLNKFIAEYDIPYPILLATEEVKKNYEIEAIPALFLFDKNGKLIYREVGFSEEKIASLKALIEGLLAGAVQVNFFGNILTYGKLPDVDIQECSNPDDAYRVSYNQLSDEFLSSLNSTFASLNIGDNPFAQMLFLIEFLNAFVQNEEDGYCSLFEIMTKRTGNLLSKAIATVAIMRRLGWDINCFYNEDECYLGINFTKDWHITKAVSIVNKGKKYILKEFDTETPAGQLKMGNLDQKFWHLKVANDAQPIPIVKDLPKINGNTITKTLNWQYIDEEYSFGISLHEEQLHYTDNLPSSIFGMAISGIAELENLEIIERLKSIVEEKSEYQQVNCLLKFCQSESIFVYDSGMDIRSITRQLFDGKNDCDGRSVFLYSLLVGVLNYSSDDIVFLHWPFHYAMGLKPKTQEAESILVAKGASKYGEYYVLDPTYTGDTFWGEKMPNLPEECEVIKILQFVPVSNEPDIRY